MDLLHREISYLTGKKVKDCTSKPALIYLIRCFIQIVTIFKIGHMYLICF